MSYPTTDMSAPTCRPAHAHTDPRTRPGAPPPHSVCLRPLFPGSVRGVRAGVARGLGGCSWGQPSLRGRQSPVPLPQGDFRPCWHTARCLCVLGVQCSTVSWAGPRLMVEARFLVVTAPALRQVCLVCVGPRGTGPRFRPRFPSALPSAMSAGSGFGLLCPVFRRSQFRRVVSSWVAVAGGVAASGCGVLFRRG